MPIRTQPTLHNWITNSYQDYIFRLLNVARIVRIESVDFAKQLATISFVDKMVIQDAEGDKRLETYSAITECPIGANYGKEGGITTPISVGESWLAIFNDRNVKAWLADGQTQAPATDRTHDYSDAILVCRVNSLRDSLTNYNPDATEIWYKNTRLSIKDGGSQINLDDLIEIKKGVITLKTVIDQIATTLKNLSTNQVTLAPSGTAPAVFVTLIGDVQALNTLINKLLK